MARRQDLAERVAPGRTALLVIDMQNDFVHAEGSTEAWMRARLQNEGLAVSTGPSLTQRMVPTLQGLVAAARAAGVPVVWVRMELDASTRDRYTVAEGWLNCERGSWGAEWYDGFGPAAGEHVVVKTRHSAFFGTDLAAWLRARGIDSVVATGTATQGCVEATVRDANAHDLWAVVVGDCCGQLDEEAHAQALARMDRIFAVAATADEVRAAWQPADAATPATAGAAAPPAARA